MVPCYFVLDCIPSADGDIRIVDVHGGVGGGLAMLANAYGNKAMARARLQPYLRRLGEVARGRTILFVHDPFAARQTFPDDFFNLVQQYAPYCPLTDWVPDLQARAGGAGTGERTPGVEEMGVFLDPVASRLRVKIAYCSVFRIDYQTPPPRRPERRGRRGTPAVPAPPSEPTAMVLLSGYRERAGKQGTSVILPPDEIGVAVFSGPSERLPDDLRQQVWFPVVNPPLLDRLLENKWLISRLLRDSRSAALLPRWTPVGMGLRTAAEIVDFGRDLNLPNGFPLAVLKPSHTRLSPGVRFLDRTALRALAARQPERRISYRLAEELLDPRIAHSYEEISGYRGKLLDNFLRTAGAEVVDHGDGTFHFTAPFPFLECTVSVLQEYVEARPIRARRTGKYHRGFLRVVMFDRKIVAALYHLDEDADDGTFRDPWRPGARTFAEGAGPEEEAALQEQLGAFVVDLETQFHQQVRSEEDFHHLRLDWLKDQTGV